MHCNLRPPDAMPVFICFNYDANTPCQVWSCSTYPLPYYSDLLLIHYLALMRCDLHLWPRTFVVYGLWPDETLYQIWVKTRPDSPLIQICQMLCSVFRSSLESRLQVYGGSEYRYRGGQKVGSLPRLVRAAMCSIKFHSKMISAVFYVWSLIALTLCYKTPAFYSWFFRRPDIIDLCMKNTQIN